MALAQAESERKTPFFVIPARHFSTAAGLLKREPSDLGPCRLPKAPDPRFREDDELNQVSFHSDLSFGPACEDQSHLLIGEK